MKDVLLIPCWRRPEFLHECITNLVATGDLDTVHVVFKPDNGFSGENLLVIESFADRIQSYEIRKASPARYRTTKQSQNVLEGYVYAASLAPESGSLVFMVEEDIMVGSDFFRFHRALHEKEDLFASLSVKNTNLDAKVGDDPGAYYLSTGDYCSLGVCIRPDIIRSHIAPHAREDYYYRPARYCASRWPDSSIGGSFIEQDGVIRRAQEVSELPTAYPHVPRAFHAGFYGYNRMPRPTNLTLEQHIERVKATIYDPSTMLEASLSSAYYQDSIPVNLHIDPWKTIKKVQPKGVAPPMLSAKS